MRSLVLAKTRSRLSIKCVAKDSKRTRIELLCMRIIFYQKYFTLNYLYNKRMDFLLPQLWPNVYCSTIVSSNECPWSEWDKFKKIAPKVVKPERILVVEQWELLKLRAWMNSLCEAEVTHFHVGLSLNAPITNRQIENSKIENNYWMTMMRLTNSGELLRVSGEKIV